MTGLLRIGQVAARAGVTARTVDFYTTLGLIRETARSGGNYRLYHPSTIERIATIRRLEGHGVPLDEIARALVGPRDPLLGQLLGQLENDLQTLHAAAAVAGAEAHGLLAAIATRAHNLIITAIEVAAGLPPPT